MKGEIMKGLFIAVCIFSAAAIFFASVYKYENERNKIKMQQQIIVERPLTLIQQENQKQQRNKMNDYLRGLPDYSRFKKPSLYDRLDEMQETIERLEKLNEEILENQE